MLTTKDKNDKVLEKITGTIERITFHNPENGFAVLKIKTTAKIDLITVVGQVINVNVGEQLECRGYWHHDKTHGKQFKAEQITSIPPTSIQGIEKYLGSGIIKGIGPGFAQRLIRKFGLQIFEVIEKYPNKLSAVQGIGQKRKELIIQSWETHKKVREIIIFLYEYGVGTTRAVRIYKTYGDNAIEKIKSNPYTLVNDIRGIGFKTADVLAVKLGIPSNSVLRAQAGIKHVLQQYSEDGHCAVEIDALILAAIKLLEIDEAIIREAINLELQEKRIVADYIGNQEVLFLASFYHAENAIAQSLKALLHGATKWKNVNLKKAIEHVENANQIKFSVSQQEAFKNALTNKVIIITGGPGVGKTTIIKSILSVVTKYTKQIMLAAPTGRAAKRLSESTGLEAKTLHRLLEIDMRSYKFRHNENNPLMCDLLVVDEVSMIDLMMMYHLLKAIPKYTALILVGDEDQLPSVGAGAVLSDLLRAAIMPSIRLTEIFRQANDSRIIMNAHRINKGIFPIIDLPTNGDVTDFYFIEEDDPELIQHKLITMVEQRIPEKFGFNPKHQIQVLTPMTRGVLGTHSLNEKLQKTLNNNQTITITRYGITYGVGDKVIQTVNNYDKEVFNGDIGCITNIDLEEGIIVINFDNREVIYEPDELDEISLAYAITIHKSQGSEYPVVVMPIAMQHFMLLERNLIYTGITRAKKLVVIIGQIKALAMAVKNKKANDRMTNLAARLNMK